MVLLEDPGALVAPGVRARRCRADDAHRRPPVWDGVGTIGIGVLLGIIAVVLMHRDAQPVDRRGRSTGEQDRAIRAALDRPTTSTG